MTCHNCEIRAGKYGKDRTGTQRFRCKKCGKTFLEPQDKPLDHMRIPMDKAVQAVKCLIEGCSIRSTQRLTGLEKKTILRLLLLAGERARRVMNENVRDVESVQIQVDEIWCYVGKKQKRVTDRDPHQFGDQYVFVAIDPETKLVPAFTVGKRDGMTTFLFMNGLRKRLRNRIQLSSDSFVPYIEATESVFGADVDYAQLVKLYGSQAETGRERYSPSRITGTTVSKIQGNPDEAFVCTSHVERQNLTMRMCMRRFTRLTNGFSKRLKNLKSAVALHFAYYNFCRIHGSLRVTPAMEAGITDHVWTVEELLAA